MIILCTDYLRQIYTGQVQSRIAQLDDRIPVINAIDDLPSFDTIASAFLLNALVDYYPENSVILGVVDPGVGGDRAPICFEYQSRQYIGPDNGLFSRILYDDSHAVEIFRICEMDTDISTTFHGRDLFAPAAVKLHQANDSLDKEMMTDSVTASLANQCPRNLEQVIYIDGYGNCMTGISGSSTSESSVIKIERLFIYHAEKFSDIAPGEIFWYVNSIGLVEIAVNQDSAADEYYLSVGTEVSQILNEKI